MTEAIRRRARELGFDDCRFTSAEPPASGGRFREWVAAGRHGEMGYLARQADKRADPCLVLPGARSVVLLATSYATGESGRDALAAAPPDGAGVVARYARFADYHDVLAAQLRELAGFVDEQGGAGTRSLWYVDTGPVMERDLAQRGGIGFVGKHTNLVSRRLGNWIFLAEILTTLPLDPDPPEPNRCGACSRCITACPTGAITAPFELDARLCISYLTIELKGPIPVPLRRAVGNRIYGCDDCLAACPWNRFSREGRLMRPQEREDLAAPRLVDLLALDDAAFKQRFRDTPMWRGKRRGLLRNVCVALGNTGGVEALPALERAAGDPEPLVAEHARWAIGQVEARTASQA